MEEPWFPPDEEEKAPEPSPYLAELMAGANGPEPTADTGPAPNDAGGYGNYGPPAPEQSSPWGAPPWETNGPPTPTQSWGDWAGQTASNAWDSLGKGATTLFNAIPEPGDAGPGTLGFDPQDARRPAADAWNDATTAWSALGKPGEVSRIYTSPEAQTYAGNIDRQERLAMGLGGFDPDILAGFAGGAEAIANMYRQRRGEHPTESPFSSFGEALESQQGGWKAIQQNNTDIDPTGGYLAGLANFGMDVTHDPMTALGGIGGRMAVAGAVAGAGIGAGYSALTSPERHYGVPGPGDGPGVGQDETAADYEARLRQRRAQLTSGGAGIGMMAPVAAHAAQAVWSLFGGGGHAAPVAGTTFREALVPTEPQPVQRTFEDLLGPAETKGNVFLDPAAARPGEAGVLPPEVSAVGPAGSPTNEAASAPALYTPEAGSTRVYHGTGSSFDRPEGSKFDESGLFGPGYYLTDDPRVASSYSMARNEGKAATEKTLENLQRAQSEAPADLRASYQVDIDRVAENLARMPGGGPNTRAVDVPPGLRLLDVEARAPDPDIEAIQARFAEIERRTGQQGLVRMFQGDLDKSLYSSEKMRLGTAGYPTGFELYHALSATLARVVYPEQFGLGMTNKVLHEMGYDGVQYAGGKRIPMSDATGQPIEHTATVIFPDSLPKVRNAISGTEGGSANIQAAVDLGGAVAGGAVGYGTDEPQRPGESAVDFALRRIGRTVAGGIGGLTAVNLATSGGRGRIRQAGEWASERGLVPGATIKDVAPRAPGRSEPLSDAARRVVDAYAVHTPGRVDQIRDHTVTLMTGEFPAARHAWSTPDYWHQVMNEASDLGSRAKMIVTQLNPAALTDFLTSGQLRSKFDALSGEDVVAATRRSVAVGGERAAGKGQSAEAYGTEQARHFVGKEASADENLFGMTNLEGRRTSNSFSRIYGAVTDGQALPNERRPTGTVLLVMDPKTTERVTSFHHHYATAEPFEDIHVSKTPQNFQSTLWMEPTGGRIDIGGGQRIVDTPWVVGPAGEDAMRASNLMQSMGDDVRTLLTRSTPPAPRDLAAILMRGNPRQDQVLRMASAGRRAEAGLPPLSKAASEEMNLAGAQNVNRTETMLIEPSVDNVTAIYLPGTEEALNRRDPTPSMWGGRNRTAREAAKDVQAKIKELTGREVPIIEKVFEPGGSKLPPEALSPGRAEVVDRYTGAGLTDIGQAQIGPALDLGGAVAGGIAGYSSQEPRRPDESIVDYLLRVGPPTVGAAVTGLALTRGATAEGRASLRELGARAKGAGLVPGLSIEEVGRAPPGSRVTQARAEYEAWMRSKRGLPPIAETAPPGVAGSLPPVDEPRSPMRPPAPPPSVPETLSPIEGAPAAQGALPLPPSPEAAASSAAWDELGSAPTREQMADARIARTAEVAGATGTPAIVTRNAARDATSATSAVESATTGGVVPPADLTAKAAELAKQPPPDATGVRRFYDRARNVIEAQGEAGQELGWRLHEWREVAETQAGTWQSSMPTVRGLKAEGRAALSALGEAGPIATTDPVVARAWQEWDQVRAAVEASAAHLGVDDIELMRPGDLREIEAASKQLARAQLFGPGGEISTGLIQRIGAEGGQAGTVRQLFDIATSDDASGSIMKWLRNAQGFLRLDRSVIGNATQTIGTASVVGALRTAKYMKLAKSTVGQEQALRMGVILDGAVEQFRQMEGLGLQGQATSWLGKAFNKTTAPFFGPVENFNRTLAALAGADFAEEAARNAAVGRRGGVYTLERMGLDGEGIAARGGELTDAERTSAARNIVERTQFKVDPQDLPGWASSPGGRLVTQFKSFSYSQTPFVLNEILRPALDPRTPFDPRPLVRWLALGLPIGYAADELSNFIGGGRDRSDDTWADRALSAMNKVGGIGLVGQIYESASRLPSQHTMPRIRNAIGTVLGPTAGTVVQAIDLASQADRGDVLPAERAAVRDIVPVAGPFLSETIWPHSRLSTHLTPETKATLKKYAVPLSDPNYESDPSDPKYTPGQLALKHKIQGPLLDKLVALRVADPDFAGLTDAAKSTTLANVVRSAAIRHGKNAMGAWSNPNLAAQLDTTPAKDLTELAAVYDKADPSNRRNVIARDNFALGDYHAWSELHGGGKLSRPERLKQYLALRP